MRISSGARDLRTHGPQETRQYAIQNAPGQKPRSWFVSAVPRGGALLGLLCGALLAAGCQSPGPAYLPAAQLSSPPAALHLSPGDLVRVTFPGAPDLNTVQKIRPDGRISLPLVGEVTAAGRHPADLQEEISELYQPHLQLKEVFVSLESLSVPVYVTGAVLRPGKILAERPLTALEAVMEAGGFDPNRANLRRVTVIRHQGDRMENYRLNLRRALSGETTDPFILQPNDIIYIPERTVWF
jgi:polysaccharide biosynthesis/export protein